VIEGEAFMHRQPTWRAASEWVAFNGLFHLLRLSGTRVTRVRYEDLVADPGGEIGRLLRSLGSGPRPSLGFVDGARVTLGVDHTVAGNPMRFASGPVELRLDEAWRASMPARARRLTTAITAPLLVLYGYRPWRP
jgi:hypothetical protein